MNTLPKSDANLPSARGRWSDWRQQLLNGDTTRQLELLFLMSLIIHLVTIFIAPLDELKLLGVAGVALTTGVAMGNHYAPRRRVLWILIFWTFWQIHATVGVMIQGGLWSVHVGFYFICGMSILSDIRWRWTALAIAETLLAIGSVAWADWHQRVPPSRIPLDDWLWPSAAFFMIFVTITVLPVMTYLNRIKVARTLQQQNQLLRETQARLIQQQRQQAQFVASVSHELRTPMNAIMGFIQSIDRSTVLDASDREMLTLMENSSHQLLGRINELLDFSQLQANKLKVRKHPIEIRRIIADVAQEFDREALQRGLQFNWQIESNVPMWVVGDRDRLTQILNHLLSNAIKFTDRGHISLRASTHESQQLVIQITDTGRGIDASHLTQLFSPLSSHTSESRRTRGGTGLGLAITQALLRLMHGTIGVHSKPGKGTTITVKLPLVIPGEMATTARKPYFQAVNPGLQGTVLVVDDSPINRMVACQLLHRELPHLELFEASSGAEAIELLNAKRVDVVLMDFVMPYMDGTQATKKIMQLNLKSTPLVLGVTGDLSDESNQEGLDSGMVEIIHKPYTRETLIPPIVRLLDQPKH